MKGGRLCLVRIVALSLDGVLTHAAVCFRWLFIIFSCCVSQALCATVNARLSLSVCRESASRSSGPSSSSLTTWRILLLQCKCTTLPTAPLVKVNTRMVCVTLMVHSEVLRLLGPTWIFKHFQTITRKISTPLCCMYWQVLSRCI